MNTRDEARAALDEYDTGSGGRFNGMSHRLAAALRTLLDETEPTTETPSHERAVYSPEVFGAMNTLLAEAQGSPMLALRLAVGDAQRVVEPTPDEREALAHVISGYRWGADVAWEEDSWEEDFGLAESILAAGFHRQGPITDDTEWEYGVAFPEGDGTWNTEGQEFESLETAREDFEKEMWLDSDRIVRRRKAGPWGPVS